MPYKTILVHLDDGPRSEARLDIALDLAARFDAHLVGLFALAAVRYPGYALAGAGDALQEALRHQRSEAAKRTKAVFDKVTKRAGHSKVEWRASGDDALEVTLQSARYADLVVVGQHDSRGKNVGSTLPGFAEELVLGSGKPVLSIPYAGKFKTVGKRVMVAWNATREAARAVTDARPLLARADTVHVVSFNPKKVAAHGAEPGADIGLALARHGVKVNVSQQTAKGIDIGSQILSRAADLDVDLIVMGAYGHSRTRELVLGGATRTLIEAMTVPVLMSH